MSKVDKNGYVPQQTTIVIKNRGKKSGITYELLNHVNKLGLMLSEGSVNKSEWNQTMNVLYDINQTRIAENKGSIFGKNFSVRTGQKIDFTADEMDRIYNAMGVEILYVEDSETPAQQTSSSQPVETQPETQTGQSSKSDVVYTPPGMVEGKIEFTASGRSSDGDIAFTPSGTMTKEPTEPERVDEAIQQTSTEQVEVPTQPTSTEQLEEPTQPPATDQTETQTATQSETSKKPELATETPPQNKPEQPVKEQNVKTPNPTLTEAPSHSPHKPVKISPNKPSQSKPSESVAENKPVKKQDNVQAENKPENKPSVSPETQNKGIDKERTARNKNAAGDITYHKDGSVTISKRVDQRIEQMAETLKTDSTALKGLLFAESGFELNGKGSAAGLNQLTTDGLNGFNKTYGTKLGKQDIRQMDAMQQLDVAEASLQLSKQIAGFGENQQISGGQLFAMNLYPANAGKQTVLSADKNAKAYRANSGLDFNKDGRVTIDEFNKQINKKAQYVHTEKTKET